MIRIPSSKILYVDRFICLEEVTLRSTEEYGSCSEWARPYLNNAQTILYFTQGLWDVRIEGAQYQPQPGEICILRCLETCMLTPKLYPCAMYRISFSANYFKIVDPSLSMNIPFVHRTLGTGNLYILPQTERERFAANLSRVRGKTAKGDKRLALFTMLLDLMQTLGDLFYPDIEDLRMPQAREVLDYINEHYCEDIGIHDLTQKLYMSRSQLERIMKTATGCSTWNYILHKRITRAMQLLHSGMSNREVARRTGFRDYSTFYKAFVKLTHQTPTGERPSSGNDPLLKNFYALEKDAHPRTELNGGNV